MADTWIAKEPRRTGIRADFLRGLSVIGLARKYGRTRAQIEAVLRRHV